MWLRTVHFKRKAVRTAIFYHITKKEDKADLRIEKRMNRWAEGNSGKRRQSCGLSSSWFQSFLKPLWIPFLGFWKQDLIFRYHWFLLSATRKSKYNTEFTSLHTYLSTLLTPWRQKLCLHLSGGLPQTLENGKCQLMTAIHGTLKSCAFYTCKF